MATFNISRVASWDDTTFAYTSTGVLALSDGSYVFGFQEDAFPGIIRWYRSTDQGLTWNTLTTSLGTRNSEVCIPAHTPNGVVCYPRFDQFYIEADIMRSTDNGAHWTSVAHYDSAASPPSRSVWTTQIVALEKNSYIAAGQFEPSGANPQLYLAKSTDNGATWTTYAAFSPADEASFCSAICNAGGGVMYASVQAYASLEGHARFYRSSDYGATWTDQGQAPEPSGCTGSVIWSLSALTPQNVVASGIGTDPSSGSEPYVWVTHDSGSTWSRLSSSNISTWGSGQTDFPGCYSVQRVTRDAAILAPSNFNGASSPLWVLSVDGGDNYDVAPTLITGSWNVQGAGQGRIVTTPEAHVLMAAWGQNDDTKLVQEIWRGQLAC